MPNLVTNSGRRWRVSGFVAAVIGVAMLALTTRSFWLDECYSARFAQQPTLHDCWNLLREVKGSDPQMPLYILWVWVCEKFVGASELALRAVNLFWFVPALLVLVRVFARKRVLQTTVFLAALVSPFAWYYLNEARVYTLQFSAGLVLLAVVIRWARAEKTAVADERKWVWVFAVALFVQAAGSLLGMFLALSPLLLLLVLVPKTRRADLLKPFWPVWVVTFGALFLVGLYYLWTLHSGARATEFVTTGWQNALFIGYELGGFAGLGPGRLEIRGGGAQVFRPWLAGLLAYASVLALLAGLGLRELRQRFGTKKLAAIFVAALLPATLIIMASVSMHFRVLGRHLAALLPVFILFFGFALALAWRRAAWGKILVAAFLVFNLASALSLRFAARHEKDNYRDAAAFARQSLAAGKTVWWNADKNGGIYYAVPLAVNGMAEAGKAWWLVHPSAVTLAAAEPATVVIASRPDVYDAAGNVAAFLARGHYQLATNLTAFTVWTRRE